MARFKIIARAAKGRLGQRTVILEAPDKETAARLAKKEQLDVMKIVPVPPGSWVYTMVQVPPSIEVQASGGAAHQAAAIYLESIVDEYAALGWEYYRVDSIGVVKNPGCLLALFGVRPTMVMYYVVTFRRRGE
jgi:molybdopterin/thiamine biosynthesis adenylyltransferase